MSRKIERRPTRRPTTDSDGKLGLTFSGAIVILSLLKDTSDTLPPLKTAAVGALALLETLKVSFRLTIIKGISLIFAKAS
jgi:hypothetical protein